MTIAIPGYMQQRFETLSSACVHSRLALMSATSARDNKQVFLLCAVNYEDNGEVSMVPLGELNASENPYDDYVPPSP
jgi:hypothetical protein